MSKIDLTVSWGLSEAPESTNHLKLKERYGLFIDGEFVKPQLRKYFYTTNPATDEVIANIAEASKKDVESGFGVGNAGICVWRIWRESG